MRVEEDDNGCDFYARMQAKHGNLKEVLRAAAGLSTATVNGVTPASSSSRPSPGGQGMEVWTASLVRVEGRQPDVR